MPGLGRRGGPGAGAGDQRLGTAIPGPVNRFPRLLLPLPPRRYVGGYWEARDAGEFTGCRDIFGAD